MNATTSNSNSGGFLGSQNIGGFGYGIGVSVGILLLITTITLASYFCTRAHPLPPSATTTTTSRRRRNRHQLPPGDPSFVVLEMGLDDATILSYPKLLYSEAIKHHQYLKDSSSSSTDACCSICLADYKSSDMLRLLPDCGHMFHLPCVDPWLRLHPTCPVCRTSPLPTPLSTPLAEVVPLASSRQGG